LLYPTYLLLRDSDIPELSLVTPDGRAFLRFNRPDLVGDEIAAERPLLARALRHQTPALGFEHGRPFPAYRGALPVHADGRLVMIADYGLSFQALAHGLRQADRTGADVTRLVLRRDLLAQVAHPSALALFDPVALAPGLVVARPTARVQAGAPEPAPEPALPTAAIDERLGGMAAVRRAVVEGRSLALQTCAGVGACAKAVLLAVTDSAGRAAGWLVAYRPAPALDALRGQYLAAFAVGSLLLVAAAGALRRWLASRQRLRTITEHMGEGLYVLDPRGRIVHINAAACALLGFQRQELLGCNAHTCFHVDSGGEQLPEDLCPVRTEPARGRVYRSDAETFQRRDGSRVEVSLVASPLREEDALAGSIVLFRDISAEREAQERLRRVNVAFRNLAEAVVVTDADADIQAVNQAFTEITGYEEAEVLGRNPRLLQSGRHDVRFYAALWRELLGTGRWEGEIWNRRKNGEIYPEWLRINAVLGPGGSVLGYVSVFSDITEQRASAERLRRLAYHDQLTGLYNRGAFMETLRHALHRARGAGDALALLYLDLDRFKRINDTLGHVSGDALLQEIGRRVGGILRPQDEAARLGGDEYVLLLEAIDARTTPARIAHQLLAAVRRPLLLEGRHLHVTASIGIAMFPDDGDDAATLLKHADAAMYLAKQQGRDGYRYFTKAMADEARRRFDLEAALREALAGDRLRVHHQPKVSLSDGRVVGLEALLRWAHPQEGLLAPGAFLDVARDAGLMQPLTEWVLHEVARQCRAWRVAGLQLGRVSVNLDLGVCRPLALEGLLLQTVGEAGIAAEDLELEILETGMGDDLETSALWRRLVAAGFELSIDDFGTGESSLARLKQLPVATLKIDRSFVADIEQDDSDRAMIRTIVAMTKTLGKRALAEGVETEAQLRFLLRTGCDAAQGYYFSRPLPAAEITALLREQPYTAQLKRLLSHTAPGARVQRLPAAS